MSNVHQIQVNETRSEQASIWVARLERGLCAEEQAEVKAWMALDSRNREELLTLAALWDQMDSLSKLSEVIPYADKLKHRVHFAIAASAAVIFTLGLLFLAEIPTAGPAVELSQRQEARYETPVGDQSTVLLNDGSVMQLNTDTKVDVLMLPDQRRLTLEHGEIHLDVAHDSARPLRVIVGDRVIEAVGTSFNVRIDTSGEMELIVTEGLVRLMEIHPGDKKRAGNAQPLIPLISENQRIWMGSDEPTSEVLNPEDIKARLSWRNGNLIFRGESLGDAVIEVGRYTDFNFVIPSEELKKVRVAGLFKAGDVEGFLRSLRASFDIVDERVDSSTIVLSAPAASRESQRQ